MTTTREFGGGFADIEGRMVSDTVQVIRFAGKQPRPRWEVKCNRCGTSWIDSHFNIVNAFGIYRCKNGLACKPRVDRPERIEREPESAPSPAKSVEQRQHELYRRYMEDQGFGVADIATPDEWARLRPEQRARILQPALMAEEAALKRKELEGLGLALENQERERFRKTYGEV